MAGPDLIVLSIPGVQRFIAEAGSTRDLANGSRAVADLMAAVLRTADAAGATLIIPAKVDAGVGAPNKAVLTTQAGEGEKVARKAAAAARDEWNRRVLELTGASATPNFPVVNWVSVSGADRNYREQWVTAHETLAARRLTRSFDQLVPTNPSEGWEHRGVCALSGRWRTTPPAAANVPAFARKERLSAVAWTKRLWGHGRMPSTYSLATAPYRSWILSSGDPHVIAAVEALHEVASGAVPVRSEVSLVGDWPDGWRRWLATAAGPWLLPESWTASSVTQAQAEDPGHAWVDPTISAKAAAKDAADLAAAVETAGGPPCARYLAVIAQDLDSMGKRLSGHAPNGRNGAEREPSPEWHQQISLALGGLARRQGQAVEDRSIMGFTVYAGGDDLLALVPASSAIQAVRRLRSALDDAAGEDLPTASTGIHFFHQAGGLQTAIEQGRVALEAAKAAPGKCGLSISYTRRSGASARIAFPWPKADNELLAALHDMTRASGAADLSPRIQNSLAREAGHLDKLSRWPDVERDELARLVDRHLNYPAGTPPTPSQRRKDAVEWAEKLHKLRGWQANTLGVTTNSSAAGTELGLFLRRECR